MYCSLHFQLSQDSIISVRKRRGYPVEDTFIDDSMNQPRSLFINGNGDEDHAKTIGDKISSGYQVVTAVFNPDGPNGARLMVLMVRPG